MDTPDDMVVADVLTAHDVLGYVLACLPGDAALRCASVSRAFRERLADDYLWSTLYAAEFARFDFQFSETQLSWRHRYQAAYRRAHLRTVNWQRRQLPRLVCGSAGARQGAAAAPLPLAMAVAVYGGWTDRGIASDL